MVEPSFVVNASASSRERTCTGGSLRRARPAHIRHWSRHRPARVFGIGSEPGRREGRVPGLPARVCLLRTIRRARRGPDYPVVTGVSRQGLRSHPSNLIRVMPAKGARVEREHAQLGHRAGSRASAGARLPRHDRPLGQPRGVAARPRRRRPARAGAVAAAGGRGRPRRLPRGQPHARRRGRDRRRRARAGDGAPPRPARPPRLVRRDRDQRRAVPRLGGLRADRDRDGGRGALRRAARLPRPVGLDARLRRDRGQRSRGPARSASSARS